MVARNNGEAPDTISRWRKHLAIDMDVLDNCLVEQPEVYYHVAQAHSMAVAERDATKMELEEAEALEAQKIRDHAAKMEEKLTESSLKEQLMLLPNIKQLRKRQIEQKADIDTWLALKEAFQQRSYMLRELVPMYLSKLSTGSISPRENPRHVLADEAKKRIDADRAKGGFRVGDRSKRS